MKEKEEKIDFVKWFSELNKNSGPVAGGKGANLGEMYNLKVNVPPGFVVTAQAYDYFIEKAGLREKMNEILGQIEYENTKELEDATKKIREMIIKADLPKGMQEEIFEAYELLDTNNLKNAKGVLEMLKNSEPIFVAVRSSATAEDLADASFAGQQETFLNVKGKTELITSIKKCFASLFTARATYYRHKKGYEKIKVSLSVVVQRMIDSEKSGVIFSKDPTNKTDNIIIEAVFGLGEGIVSGRITPDKYILSSDLEILDKKISDKKVAITRDSGGGQKLVKLSEEKSNQQVLKEYEIKKFAEISLKLEEHYKKPQDIEFAVENGELYILQTRAVTTREKKIETEEIEGEVILSGLGASPGIGSGKVKVIKDLADLNKIVEGDILVTIMTNPDMVVTMQKSAAIITDEGGLTAHAAIVSREMGIPAVVGTRDATEKLKDGDIVTVDGSSGQVYKGKIAETKKKEILPVTTKTKTRIKLIVDLPTFAERASLTGIKHIGLTRIEGIIAESGKHPNYFLNKGKIEDYEEVIFKGLSGIAKFFDEMWVRTSDIRSDEFQNLEGASAKVELNPMLGMHGIRYGIKNPKILKAELNAMKRVAASGKKVGIMMPQIISVEEVQKVKEILKEINFSTAKLGVMIETPAAVQIIKELCEEGIEFISFGTNDLTQYILAVDRGNEEVQHIYNEMHPAVLYQIEFVIRVCKRNNVETSICGQAGSRKDMVKFLVEKGIDSISVNADVAKEISDYVAEIERVRGEEPRQYQSKEKEAPIINGVEGKEEEFYEEEVAPVKDDEEEKGVLDIF
ncbi:MAG: phosphoenolpyruvate synthase [Candidatus Nanoarchaeia archaeon]|nr:phosphoenolpyruvate synthase [Candidatus Nanoarchaeia archaeon]MDD5357895.1 phosphoenolpyruvate synthase [Candidatus Nanoarchaeia archaeon]MDD5588814.1 phosphoenolpyruvate synthase [Candidatus Nanoarchaeia archaeon]